MANKIDRFDSTMLDLLIRVALVCVVYSQLTRCSDNIYY